MKQTVLLTATCALLAFAGFQPTAALAGPAEDKAAPTKVTPSTKQDASANGDPTPSQILEKEMGWWLDQAAGLSGVGDKTMTDGQYALASVFGSINVTATTMGLEIKCIFMQEGILAVFVADKKAETAAAQLLFTSYASMCTSIDHACIAFDAQVFNLKKLNFPDDAKRVEEYIKRLRYLQTEFFAKRRDQLKAFTEANK